MPANQRTIRQIPPSAREKIELSQLKPGTFQRETMGDDLDLERLVVYLKGVMLFDSVDRIINVSVSRTIEGASTVEIVFNDYDRSMLRSNVLNSRLDINIDGLWFRLVKLAKNPGEDDITITFEQREIALLRNYPLGRAPHNGVKFAHRDKVTRAQFILNLIREVKEVEIPVVMPHLLQFQKVAKATSDNIDWSQYLPKGSGAADTASTSPGLEQDYNHANLFAPEPGAAAKQIRQKQLTVKGDPMTKEQIRNANAVLQAGLAMKARRKVLVAAIMTTIQESDLKNLTGGDGTSVGLFQQIDTGWGSYEDRHDPTTASRSFFSRAIPWDKDNRQDTYNNLCQGVQRSGHPDAYGQWRTEAERITTAFGVPGQDEEASAWEANNMGDTFYNGTEDFLFYRGVQKDGGKRWAREDNWTCIRRLADEVGWRAFFIGGVFYYMTDEDLYKTQPMATVTESTKGVMGIGFDYDVGKYGATVDIPARVGLWSVPPGAIIILQQMGPLDGRWLVTTFSRSLFDSNADIALAKPQPKLSEPIDDGVQTPPTWAVSTPPAQGTVDTSPAMGGDPTMNDGSRKALVAVAQKAYETEQKWHYHYPSDEGGGGGPARPIPGTLWSQDAHDAIDCSAFATLVYKEAGLPDPNGNNYNGGGNTGDLVAHGFPVSQPSPGDLIFYGGSTGFPEHVAVYIGGGQVIEIGSEHGILKIASNYRSDQTAIRSYIKA